MKERLKVEVDGRRCGKRSLCMRRKEVKKRVLWTVAKGSRDKRDNGKMTEVHWWK